MSITHIHCDERPRSRDAANEPRQVDRYVVVRAHKRDAAHPVGWLSRPTAYRCSSRNTLETWLGNDLAHAHSAVHCHSWWPAAAVTRGFELAVVASSVVLPAG
jgi:hypothetical protein